MSFDVRSAAAGLFFVALGAVVVAVGLAELDIGTAFRMGPGYFPMLLGGLCLLLGLAIVGQSLASPPSSPEPVAWRAMLCVGVAPVIFGLVVRGLGLAPAIALTAFVAALGSRSIGMGRAIAVAAALTLFCILIFSYGLGLSFRLVGPWLGG